MGSRIENLIRTAVQTFATRPSGSFVNSNISQNIQILRQLLCEICPADDIGLLRTVGQPRFSLNLLSSKTAPVSYMEIFENQTVSIGVFILKEGASIPLHDHVGMYGILKVLYGSLNVQSYSPIDLTGQTIAFPAHTEYVKVKRFPTNLITEKDSSIVLTPSDHNMHTIWTAGGPASFLDILAPPYDPEGILGIKRDCYYYSDVGEVEGTPPNPEIRLLKKITCPSSFWCDSLTYQGPDVHHLHEELH